MSWTKTIIKIEYWRLNVRKEKEKITIHERNKEGILIAVREDERIGGKTEAIMCSYLWLVNLYIECRDRWTFDYQGYASKLYTFRYRIGVCVYIQVDVNVYLYIIVYQILIKNIRVGGNWFD